MIKIKLVVKHGIISSLCAISDYAIFIVLYKHLNFDLNISFWTSYIFVSIFGFLGHAHFTFDLRKVAFKNIFYFLTQLLIVASISYIILSHLVILIDIKFAKIIQLFCTFFFNVFYGKFVSFK
jgi:hypothetical protein